ncbi:MAG: asparagine synthase (glutamine-hydrolyzing) [Blautia sp.]
MPFTYSGKRMGKEKKNTEEDMCGICGFTGYRQDQKDIIEKMMRSIAHRGPDSAGSFCDEKIALGFRRLSIIDLEEGHQPMESADGNLHLVFNGEIYDYKELRTELEKAGISFRTHSDTEVLVNTIQQYGEKALDKLRGMFGFAVWNEKEQTLMLARDFFGIKPVYYAQIDGHFVFASEIKSILAFPGYERKVNQQALEQYLSFQYSPLEETFFKGIYKLMPGHILIHRQGRFEIKEYFHPYLEPKNDPAGEIGAEALQNRLRGVLRESVEHHMLSDVEVGAFLSGGVDSGYLAAVSGADQAFTVGFDEGEHYSEVDRAKEVAQQAGLKHHIRIIGKQEFWDSLPDVMYYMDEPLGDASAVALYFLAEEASRYVKVVLSGEGADELFGGYNIYREPDSLKAVSWIPRGIRRKIGQLAAKLPDIKGAYIYREKPCVLG